MSSSLSMWTPCVGVCRLDGQRVCVGCGRTLDEIATWTRRTDAERSSWKPAGTWSPLPLAQEKKKAG